MAWFTAAWEGWEKMRVQAPPETYLSRRLTETGCPLCGAPRGSRCVTRRGVKAKNPHGPRIVLFFSRPDTGSLDHRAR